MNCCSQFGTIREGSSPFFKNIVLGFHDGPMEGFVRCEFCGQPYYYKILAWDNTQTTRLFALSCIERCAFDEFERLLEESCNPKYPDWVVLWDDSLGPRRTEMESLVKKIISGSQSPSFLVIGRTPTGDLRVSRVTDTIKQIIQAKMAANDTIDGIEQWKDRFEG